MAGRRCVDQVRIHTAQQLFSLIGAVAAGKDDAAISHAGKIAALTGSAAGSDPVCRQLVLALERWLLHPGHDTAVEICFAAAAYTMQAPEQLLRRAWVAGAGLDSALAEISEKGLQSAEADGAVTLIEEACTDTVPLVWVSQRCGVSRNALRRRIRDRHR